jgi:hypothetical protein
VLRGKSELDIAVQAVERPSAIRGT